MAVFLAMLLFSLAGIPPLAGFFAKFYVFLAAIQAGLFTLAVIGVVLSVVGAYYYLVIVKHSKRADLRALADQIGDGKLSFASPDRLMTCLGLTPGSVSPFGLIHDAEHHVRVILDRDLKSAQRVSFHPNINTVTLTLAFADFEKFLDACGNIVRYVTV